MEISFKSFYPNMGFIAGEGLQGWMWNPFSVMPENHNLYHRIDILNLSHCRPFIQERGHIYWLDVSVGTAINNAKNFEGLWGWKTSNTSWMDDAVYWDDCGSMWKELRLGNESLDLGEILRSRTQLSRYCQAEFI